MHFPRWGRTAMLVLGLATVAAQAQTTAWTYQGRLKNGGTPTTGNYDFIFRLYDAATGGTLLGTINQTLPVSGGLFTANLDFGNQFPSANRWLHISVRPSGGGAYTPLDPRQPLTPAPYAIGLELPFVGATTYSGSSFTVSNNDGTGVAGSSPNQAGVSGTNTNSSSVTSAGVVGTSTATAGNGVSGFADVGSSAYGVYAEAVDGYALYGYSNTGHGLYTSSSSGVGAEAFCDSGAAVIGTSNSAPGVHGVDNNSSDVNAAGVYGEGLGTDGNGVTGRADNGGSAYGVYGHATDGYAVYGDSSNGTGVYGDSSAGPGVHGINYNSTDTHAAGVVGESLASAGNGVSGICDAGGAAYGVYGEATNGGYAGFFNGDVHVNGSLSKGGGSFKIDHPLDPANQYLYHSFVESPDMKNVYDGVVTTDANGYASVALPNWFQTLNRDFRYQLTVIDENDSADFVQAKIVGGIHDNQFTLRTSAPQTLVSWQVTGIRQDPWANAYRIPVEQQKSALERGLYLHPELYGQPASLGMQTAKARAAAQATPGAAPALPLGKGPANSTPTPRISGPQGKIAQ